MKTYILLSVIIVQIGIVCAHPYFFNFDYDDVMQLHQTTMVIYYLVLAVIPLCGIIIVSAGLIVGCHPSDISSKIISITYFLMIALYLFMGADAALSTIENEPLNKAFDLMNGNPNQLLPIGIFDWVMLFCVMIALFPNSTRNSAK